MVKACSAFGCTNRYKKDSGLGFFRFPANEDKRFLWIKAVRRKDWLPSSNSVICGEHFQTKRPNKDEMHPDYIPNVFSFSKPSVSARLYEKRKRLEEKRQQNLKIMPSSPVNNTPDKKFGAPVIVNIGKSSNSDCNMLCGDVTIADSVYDKEKEHLKMRVKELEEQNKKLEENINKIFLSTAVEMQALRDEISSLKEKLSQTDFSAALLNDDNKLKFYTGVNSAETFKFILLSTKEYVDANFEIAVEKQLLITLIKLRLKLQDEILAYNFNTSRRTVKRIISAWYPALAEAFDNMAKL